MRLKPLALSLLGLISTTSALAGQISFVSATLTVPMAPTTPASPLFTTSGNSSVSGRSFTAGIHLYNVLPVSGSGGVNSAGTAEAVFKVRWLPDYPGEPKPSNLTGGWTNRQQGNALAGAADGRTPGVIASITLQAGALPPGSGLIDETYNLDPVNFPLGLTTTDTTAYDIGHGGFNFADESGVWTGTGTIPINVSNTIGWTVTAPHAIPNVECSMQATLTLTSVGGYPVL